MAYQQAYRIADETGSRIVAAKALRGFGDLSRRRCSYEDALGWYQDSKNIAQKVGLRLCYHSVSYREALAHVAVERFERAMPLLEAALTFYQECEDVSGAAKCATALISAGRPTRDWKLPEMINLESKLYAEVDKRKCDRDPSVFAVKSRLV
jgi:hypothetical protein